VKKTLYIAALLGVCSACSQYSVTLNDAPIYQPQALLRDYTVADPALKTCLAQTIKALNITKATQLVELRCIDAGITKLDGLKIFSQISVIDLADNDIKNVTELSQLFQLTQVNLRGNANLLCDDIATISGNIAELALPRHCEK
jgi:hypothetical protein